MKKKLLSIVLASAMVLSLAACGKEEAPASTSLEVVTSTSTEASTETVETTAAVRVTERLDDEEVYETVLGEFTALVDAAKAASSISERFALFAKAEAYLMDSATMLPTTTRGGAYTISRVAPRTVPYVQWGNDDDRLHKMVISDDFCTPEERSEMLAQWAAAVAGEGEYDPAAYLISKGHTIQDTYTTTFQTAPVTIDWLNTSSQADTEITVNTVEGLVEYNNLGQMQPALAESWSVSDDGLTYTFKIREGAAWYTSEGAKYADVTAADFVAGFHHMLDTQAGLEWLVEGVVKGASEYLAGGSFDEVGYAAPDAQTLVVTLEQPTSYFMTMLTYSCFLPICESFYAARGGVYGQAEYSEASANTNTYTFGSNTDVASQVYCGPFLLQKMNEKEIVIVKNDNYWNAATTTLKSVKWVWDNGENPDAFYNDVLNGIYAGCALNKSTGLLDKAKEDGNFDKYSYVSDTESTTYFGGINVNRGTFALESGAVASPKNDEQIADARTALLNKNFRKALIYSFDKQTWNGVTRGEELALTNVRNIYTHPEFVQLDADVTIDGHTFKAGTFYGEMVQAFCDDLGVKIDVKDGTNGLYNPEEAKACLAKAVEELGDTVSYPIQIDVEYYSASDSQTAQAAAFKSVIEGCLGADKVQINMVEATTPDDYYAAGYRASNGEAGDFDIFYGSGWGPDYGDPSTYLDTFLGEGAGYMTKVIGLF